MSDYDKVVEEPSYVYYCHSCGYTHTIMTSGKFTTPRCPKCHYALHWQPRLEDKIENPNGEDITLPDLIKKYLAGELVEITLREMVNLYGLLEDHPCTSLDSFRARIEPQVREFHDFCNKSIAGRDEKNSD